MLCGAGAPGAAVRGQAVKHRQFMEMGKQGMGKLLKKGGVLYDVKEVVR